MRAFIKLVVGLTLVAGLMFEVGSPLWGRSDAAGAAQDAAAAAARDYFTNNNLDEAKQAAVDAATVRGATVTKIELEPDGSIKITVSRPAKSYVLHDISALKNWYNVTASATASPIHA